MIVLSLVGLSACDSQGEPPCCEAPQIAVTMPDSVIMYTDEESRRLDLAEYIQTTGDLPLNLTIGQAGTSADVLLEGYTLVFVPREAGVTIARLKVSTSAGDVVEDSIAVDVRDHATEPLAFLPFHEGNEWVYDHRTGDVTVDGRWEQESTVTIRVDRVSYSQSNEWLNVRLLFDMTGRKGSTDWEQDSLVWSPVQDHAEVTLRVTSEGMPYPLFFSHLPFDDSPRVEAHIPRFPDVSGDTLVIQGSTPYTHGRYEITLVRGIGIVEESSFGCSGGSVNMVCWGGDAQLQSSSTSF